MGPVIGCSGPRGTVRPSNGGVAVLGQLIADVTGRPYAEAATRMVLGPLGLRDLSFTGSRTDIGPGAVASYHLTREGTFEPTPALIPTIPAAGGELVAFVSFFVVQAALSGHHLGVSLSPPGVPGAVLADGLILFVAAMMGPGQGAIIRHTAGGIAALAGLIILPAILGLLPAPWGGRVSRFTLLQAAHQVTALHPASNLFSPAASLLVLHCWPALIRLAAALTITRRDA